MAHGHVMSMGMRHGMGISLVGAAVAPAEEAQRRDAVVSFAIRVHVGVLDPLTALAELRRRNVIKVAVGHAVVAPGRGRARHWS